MAKGDVYVLHASVNNNAYLTLQPASNTEIVINNIYVSTGATCTVERFDGTNSLVFTDTLTGVVALTNLQFHCTNTDYIRVFNNTGSAKRFAADGIYTK